MDKASADHSIDFWQREAMRAKDSATVSSSRVHTALSFGIAAMLAATGFGLLNNSYKVIAAVPLGALFILALVIRSTIEALYEAGFELFAERRLAELLKAKKEPTPPIWRSGGEPLALDSFSRLVWTLASLAIAAGAAAAETYAVIGTKGDIFVIGCIGLLAVGGVSLAIFAFRALGEVKSFLDDPRALPAGRARKKKQNESEER